MRLTYGQLVQDSRICIPLNLSPTDDRLRLYVNEACERFFWMGENFWGLTQRFSLCVRDGCVTMPRNVASIESVWRCNAPLQIRNQWFESLESGPGLQANTNQNGSCGSSGCSGQNNGFLFNWNANWGNSYDRGTACTFRDIVGTNKKIRVYCDVAESADDYINLQGYDADTGEWIRTEYPASSGIWIDGENVPLNAAVPQLSTKKYSSLVAAQKPITNGNVRLYSYNTDDATQIAIAIYEPSETLPVYRRILIPNLNCVSCCTDCTDDSGCELKRITVIARMEFIPIMVNTDWVLPANPSAIKDMVQSIRWMENNDPQQAMICEQRAKNALQTQLRHYLGHAIVQPIKMLSNAVANPGGIPQLY